ncbi:MAG: diadenylate cyclase CdaA, partial [Clostridia bacterium]|nr:diadenylate cyclase CdaA [Clostridia bacterium]
MDGILYIWDQICKWFMQYVVEPMMHIGWRDIIDILLLATLLFAVYRFTRNRRAGRVTIGLLLVIFVGTIVRALDLKALTYITDLFAVAAFFCIVVIYQPEIRDALERIGNFKFLNPGSDSLPKKHYALAKSVADEVVDAVEKMSESKTGALIVFEGLTKLGDHMGSGKIVDARVTSHLLQNIFYDKAPLHDGALIIRNMRIHSASCVLPSTKGDLDFGRMGTRHRAAVGVTEVSDALALMVSEETGTVSVAQDGKLLRGVDAETLRDILMTYLAGRLYLRVKRGVHVDHFDGVPVLRRNYTDEDRKAAEPAVEQESDLSQMSISFTEQAA